MNDKVLGKNYNLAEIVTFECRTDFLSSHYPGQAVPDPSILT